MRTRQKRHGDWDNGYTYSASRALFSTDVHTERGSGMTAAHHSRSQLDQRQCGRSHEAKTAKGRQIITRAWTASTVPITREENGVCPKLKKMRA